MGSGAQVRVLPDGVWGPGEGVLPDGVWGPGEGAP